MGKSGNGPGKFWEIEMALTKNDGEQIMGMIARGDKKHEIAAWYGENPARIAEVESGQAFGHLTAAPAASLPPRGSPGLKGRKLKAHVKKAIEALDAGNLDAAKKHLNDGVAAFEKNEV